MFTAEQTAKRRAAAIADTEQEDPTDRIVKNIRLTSMGSVLRPSDEVMQIVLTGEELMIAAKVSPADIAYAGLGQLVSVKFDAYDSSIFGSVNSIVCYISYDTSTDQKPNGNKVYYRVHIRVDTKSMRSKAGNKVEIQPSKTATAEIITDTKVEL